MPSYHLYTFNYTEEKYTGEHVEQIVAQDASTETAQFIIKQKNNLISHGHLQMTWQLTVPQGIPETQPGKPLCWLWPMQTPFKPASYHTE